MVLTAHGATHPGRRSSNEDAWLVDGGLGLFIVADGMGGHNAGEVAAHLAIEAIKEFVQQSRSSSDATWPFGFDPQMSLEANRLRNATRLANNRVFDLAQERSDYTGMGTTIVAALVADGRLVFVGVGDSRVYLWRRGELTQLTRDDSWVATVLARDPEVSETSLAHHPMRHVLTSVIGARTDTDAQVEEQSFDVGDVLLLCSDGLHGAVDSADLTKTLGSGQAIDEMAASLVGRAIEHGASDNVTAVVVRRDG